MDLDPLLLYIKIYETQLNNILFNYNYKVKVKLKLRIGYYRCMARIQSSKIKGIDINKRCSKHIFKLNLCKAHYCSNKMGLINCVPTKDIIEKYKNHLESLNLNHIPFFSLNLKKKNTDIIKMSLSQLNYSICKHSNGSPDEQYNEVLKHNKLNKLFITTGEKKSIMNNIEKIQIEMSIKKKKLKKINKKHNSRRQDLKKKISGVNISKLNSIKIIDENFNHCELFEVIFRNKINLINNKKQIIGQFNNWIDDLDEIPREYKTADNKVLHPLTCLPILEIVISDIESIYCDIIPGTYREYVYDDDLESFKKTNSIIRVSN